MGWPPDVVKLVKLAWQHERFLVWDGDVHDQTLRATHAVPQGCPLAPVVVATWTSSGAWFTAQKLREAGVNPGPQTIYMDDRTFCSPTWHEVDLRIKEWRRWSDSVNLVENQTKTQVTSRGSGVSLQPCPQEWRRNDIKFLGAHSVHRGGRACLPAEQARIDKALGRCELLRRVGLPFEGLIRAAQAAVLPLAAYGWVGRRPTWKQGNSLFNALTRAHGAARMANNSIRKVLYGARTHLDLITGTRLLRRVHAMIARGTASWANNAASQVGLLRRWLIQ